MKIQNLLIYMCLSGLLVTSCEPRIKKGKELPAPSAPSFSMTQYIDPQYPLDLNTYIIRNTTEGGFNTFWEIQGIGTSRQDIDTVYFSSMGDYTIKLNTSSPGGSGSTSQVLHIPADSPYKTDFSITNSDAYHFTATIDNASNVISSMFKFENGDTSSATSASVYFPFAGTFDITLYATTAKGSSVLTKTVTVASDDMSNPALTDPIFLLLTGGLGSPKTWKMCQVGWPGASPSPYSGGVGPYNTLSPDWWWQPDGFYGTTWDDGMAANEFTFDMREYQYKPLNQKVTAHWAFANKFFGKSQAQYADINLVDPNHKQCPFILINENNGIGTGYTLRFTNGSYLGYFDNRNKHQIIRINSDSLYIRHTYNDDANVDPSTDNANSGCRYFTFVKK